jgi:polyketide cyclase/dehydrase/lipid transport protein
MGRATASIEVPGLASEAEALWYDPIRWAAWVDGFGHVVELSDGWPADGVLRWNSTPGGRGLVLETVLSYEPRSGQSLAVEDGRLHGTQRVEFTPGPDAVTVALTLDYRLKQRNPLTPLLDALFVRREIAASLRRTLARFARERRGDLELEAEASR